MAGSMCARPHNTGTRVPFLGVSSDTTAPKLGTENEPVDPEPPLHRPRARRRGRRGSTLRTLDEILGRDVDELRASFVGELRSRGWDRLLGKAGGGEQSL